MKIKFSQTGGFAGLTRGCELDTQSLPTDEAAKLQSLVEESGILQSQSSNSNTSNARDAFNYNITIETNDGDEQTISYDDLNQPENTPKSTRENGSPAYLYRGGNLTRAQSSPEESSSGRLCNFNCREMILLDYGI